MKRFIVLVGVAVFLLGVAGTGSATWDDFFYGSVTSVKGNTVTVKNDAGQIKTFQASSLSGIKVGDKVRARGNLVQGSWDWGNNAPKTQAAQGARTGSIRAEEGEDPVQTRQGAVGK